MMKMLKTLLFILGAVMLFFLFLMWVISIGYSM